MQITRLSSHTYRRLALIACTRYLPWEKADLTGALSFFLLMLFCPESEAAQKSAYVFIPENRPNDDELKILDFLLAEYRRYCENPNTSPRGFETKASLELFGTEMVVIDAIDRIMQYVKHPQWAQKQKYGIIVPLILKLCSSERELSAGLRAVLPEFSAILSKLFSEDFNKKSYDIYFDKYIELYHQLNLLPKKTAPDKKEKIRRNRISATKQEQFSKKQACWAEHEKKIRDLYKQGNTMKSACEIYFNNHQDALRQIGICSWRTLQNKLTGQKHPDRRRKERNEIDATFAIHDPDLSHLLTLINHNT